MRGAKGGCRRPDALSEGKLSAKVAHDKARHHF